MKIPLIHPADVSARLAFILESPKVFWLRAIIFWPIFEFFAFIFGLHLFQNRDCFLCYQQGHLIEVRRIPIYIFLVKMLTKASKDIVRTNIPIYC